MLPENCPEIRRLLLLYFINEVDLLAQFLSVSNQICHQFPTFDIALLLLNDEQYGLYPVHSNINLDCSELSLTPRPSYGSLIDRLQQGSFDAAIVLTAPHQSPYSLAYLCYLAKIPIRIGQSQEFGGGVLSHWIQPPASRISIEDYNRHLLQFADFLSAANAPLAIA